MMGTPETGALQPGTLSFPSRYQTGLVRCLNVMIQTSTAAAPGNLLEMLILRPHARPIESGTPGGGFNDLCFNKPSR